MVDDDNEPAPENIPTPDDANASDVFTEWGDTGVCGRKLVGSMDVAATSEKYASGCCA